MIPLAFPIRSASGEVSARIFDGPDRSAHSIADGDPILRLNVFLKFSLPFWAMRRCVGIWPRFDFLASRFAGFSRSGYPGAAFPENSHVLMRSPPVAGRRGSADLTRRCWPRRPRPAKLVFLRNRQFPGPPDNPWSKRLPVA